MKRASSKMKLLWKQYGLVAIGTYTVLYVAGFGGVYLVLVTGLVDPDVRKTALIPNCTRVLYFSMNSTLVYVVGSVIPGMFYTNTNNALCVFWHISHAWYAFCILHFSIFLWYYCID